MHPYRRFAAMIAASTLVMFGLMYLNTYALDHIYFSETRAYMALVMGSAMAVVMLAFMAHMLPSRKSTSESPSRAFWSLRRPCGWCAAKPPSTRCRT